MVAEQMGLGPGLRSGPGAAGGPPGWRTGTPHLEDQLSQLQAEGTRVKARGLPRPLCSQQLLQSWQLLPLRA